MTFFMFLHQTQATRWFLSSLTKFYPRLTPVGTRNPNFDSTVRIGWDQCHCKHYQISFPTTIHWSKSKLKQLRYIENHGKYINTVPEAITFDPTVGFSISLVFWKLDIQSFPRTLRSTQSESRKAFKYTSEVNQEKAKIADVSRVASNRRKPKGNFSNINAPRPLILPPKKKNKKIKKSSW